MTSEELQILIRDGGREWRVEVVDGRLMVDWSYECIAGPAEARAMAALGVRGLRSALDAVLDDDESREEARRRLCRGRSEPSTAPTVAQQRIEQSPHRSAP